MYKFLVPYGFAGGIGILKLLLDLPKKKCIQGAEAVITQNDIHVIMSHFRGWKFSGRGGPMAQFRFRTQYGSPVGYDNFPYGVLPRSISFLL